ncbi:uncharacterized protein LOC120357367 [Solenopsis invicta]|uniref:uncharacterized protein LOC120357367 n=1 Tax=Solenopsis invicta TaxID=13686 RepID=UPI00193DABB5|nr:uncharacterized protein LOC120357367 [Solenopsis invicta]
MVEKLHRQLKAAIKSHQTKAWAEILLVVLMSIRAAWKEDLQATPAEMVYGEPIWLPGQFLNEADSETDTSEGFVKEKQNLKKTKKRLRPKIRRHKQKTTFIFKDLATTQQVFLRYDTPTKSLQRKTPPLKPAYILEPEKTEQNQSATEQAPKLEIELRLHDDLRRQFTAVATRNQGTETWPPASTTSGGTQTSPTPASPTPATGTPPRPKSVVVVPIAPSPRSPRLNTPGRSLYTEKRKKRDKLIRNLFGN